MLPENFFLQISTVCLNDMVTLSSYCVLLILNCSEFTLRLQATVTLKKQPYPCSGGTSLTCMSRLLRCLAQECHCSPLIADSVYLFWPHHPLFTMIFVSDDIRVETKPLSLAPHVLQNLIFDDKFVYPYDQFSHSFWE